MKYDEKQNSMAWNCLFLLGNSTECPTKCSEKYFQLIEAPTSLDKWDAWHVELKAWKDSTLKFLKYKGVNYEKKDYKWASSAYSTFFLMANDKNLYDNKGNYNIKNCLKKYEKDYGGVDVVVLWPTYPQLGFDDRTQYSFYRNMPKGIAGLKQLTNELHAMGKKMMIAYNPWNNSGRNQRKSDDEELLNMLKETGADGVYLDTISNIDGFFQQMQRTNKGAIFQSEIPINPEALNQVHQSWLEVGWNDKVKNLEFAEVTALVRNRWLEQRHVIYRLSRFSHEQSILIQNAWINGCGVVFWENVFGMVNELNPRDRTLISSMLPVLRQYTSFFTEGQWLPLFPTKLNRVYASQWSLKKTKLWTIINRQEQMAIGKILEEEFVKGTKYFDLITGKEVKTRVENGKVNLLVELKPKAIAGLISIPENEQNAEFYAFLK